MQHNFITEDITKARAALLIYAIFKSRDKNSPLSGVETWNRTESFCKGACLKSSTTSEFVTKFKEMAKVGAIKPTYLSDKIDGKNYVEMPDGSIIAGDGVKDYQIGILEDNSIRDVIEREYPLIVMLVRERIQREKMLGENDYEENEN